MYGRELTFERLDSRKGCRVTEVRDGDIWNEEEWPEYLEWFLDRQRRLREALQAVGGVPTLD